MSGSGDWHPGPLEDKVSLLGVRVAVWNHMKYPEEVPAAGEHDADAIRAGHGAVRLIDEIIRDLHVLREAMVTELRDDAEEHGRRVDAMLEAERKRREEGR